MLSLVLIRTIDRGSNAESQKKHRQRLNQTAQTHGNKTSDGRKDNSFCIRRSYQWTLSLRLRQIFPVHFLPFMVFYSLNWLSLAAVLAMLKEREQPHRWLLLQPLMMESCPGFCFSTQSTCFTHRAESSVPISEKRSNGIAVSTQSAWFAQPCSHQLKLLGQAWKSSSHMGKLGHLELNER